MLVQSIDKDPWRRIENQSQRSTWANSCLMDASMPILFYQGTMRGFRCWAIGGASRLALWAARNNRESPAATARLGLIRAAAASLLPGRATQAGDVLTVSVPATYGMLAARLWAALNYLLTHEAFDYGLQTNTSMHKDRARLAQFVTLLPRTGYYGGLRGVSGD